jgi:peptidoglycan hydrolase-like protein with peptidoglycan-binding domain
MLRKVITTAAAGAAVFAAIPVTGALADGPDTPPSVAREIRAQSWPVLQRGDQGEGVRGAQYLLRGYQLTPARATVKYAIPTDGNFEAVTEKAVTAFQGWRDLPETGKVDGPVWDSISADLKTKPIAQGSGNHEFVRAAQVLVNTWGAKCGYKPVTVDGLFGTGTYKAVVAFQKCQGLDPDGRVGPLTLKAVVANF